MKKTLIPVSLRYAAVLAMSIAVSSAVGCHRDPNVLKQKYLESGKRFAQEGKYKEATIQFSNALKVDKNFGDAHYELAKAYIKSNGVLQGYTELLRTVDLQPGNLQARIDLGNILLAGNQPKRALDQANAVLAVQSDNAEAHALLSSIAAYNNDRATAMAEIQKALEIDPKKATYHAALGLIQSSDPASGNAAEDQLRKAIELDPKNITARFVLSALLERKKDIPGALEQMKAAVTGDPKSVPARGNLAGLYLRSGDKAAAEETLRQAADELSDSKEASTILMSYYTQTNQTNRAEPAYAALLAKHPKSAPLKLEYARILLAEKQTDKAKTLVAELVKSDPNDPEVAVLNGGLLLNDGKVNEAFNVLQKSAKSNPQNFQVKLWLGRVAVAKGDMAVAEQSYRDASQLNPKSIDALSGLAQTALAKRDYSLLIQVAESSMAVAPQLPNPYVWRGLAEQNQKQTEKAKADFHQALKLNDKDATASLQLAQIALGENKLPEARTLLEQTLTNSPGSVRALGLITELDLYQKQPAKALARIQDLIAKSPQQSELYDQLSDVQRATGDIPGALASGEKAMKLNPADNEAIVIYTRALLASGNVDQAVDSWQRWTEDHPKDAQADAVLGSLLESKGDREKATIYYKKALQIQPEQAVAANNLAYIMIESGQNIDVALSLAQTARRLLPNSPSSADTLAWAYYHKASYLSARDLLEDSLKTAPGNSSLQYHLGMTYLKLDDKTNASLHLKKASELDPKGPTGDDARKALATVS
jgi:Flp pilus assembly protein TadD